MITVDEAKALIQSVVKPLGSERLMLGDALGRILAADVVSPINMPGFCQSAMDGYAFSWDGYQQFEVLDVVGVVAAGAAEAGPRPAPNQAVRIFTGAPVPEGFDTVVMQEKVRVDNQQLYIEDAALVQGRNVRLVGSEIAKDALAMLKGTRITPAAVGFLASLGFTEVEVLASPKIVVIVTGDELQSPGKSLGFGQVYESNSQLLQSSLKWLRFSQVKIVYAKDDLLALTEVMTDALNAADLVLLTGGVSVGDFDFVPKAAANAGVNAVFHKIKQKPGKPLFFGKFSKELGQNNLSDTYVFGLPGNPGSVLTCFYQYVAIALEILSGTPSLCETGWAKIQHDYAKNAGLTHFLKAETDWNDEKKEMQVAVLGAQESFRLSSFARANALIEIPADVTMVAAGDSVKIYRID
jgi:molybdopterin molybdotransferase